MGSLCEEINGAFSVSDASGVADGRRKPRFLCLHGFRTSGDIMRAQVVGKWPEEVTGRMELFFPNGQHPAAGKSEVDGIFPPPYYEWFQFDKEFMVYTNLEEAFEYIENLMVKHGPFDGLLGFSQGAILSAALVGLQSKGLALQRVPKLKYLVIIGGAQFHNPEVAERVYPSKYECTSLHILGEKDYLRKYGEKLLQLFVDPFVIHHPKGHTVPRLDDDGIKIMNEFLRKIEDDLSPEAASIDATKEA